MGTDDESTQPKLSLLLNCMGVETAGIEATRDMDLKQFTNKARWRNISTQAYGEWISPNTLRDLYYCGQLVGECKYRLVCHDDKCPVCACRTPQQLINFLKERGIRLNSDVIIAEELNGRRVLYCSSDEFPDEPPEEVQQAIFYLQCLHGAKL